MFRGLDLNTDTNVFQTNGSKKTQGTAQQAKSSATIVAEEADICRHNAHLVAAHH